MQESVQTEGRPEPIVTVGRSGHQGTMVVSPGKVFFALVNIAYEDFADVVIREVDPWIAEVESLEIVVDASMLKTYAPQFRERWIRWLVANRHKVKSIDLLAGSAMVVLGVNAVAAALPGSIVAYRREEKFGGACRQRLGLSLGELRVALRREAPGLKWGEAHS